MLTFVTKLASALPVYSFRFPFQVHVGGVDEIGFKG